MFQNKAKTKLKQNIENKKQRNKKYLKLDKIEERNLEKIEIMKEKINIIQEKLSLFKSSKTTKNKKISRNSVKIERKISLEEKPEKHIKQKDLLNIINISPNFQHISDYKSTFNLYANNIYNKYENIQLKNESSQEKSINDFNICLSNEKDYFIEKKKENSVKNKFNNDYFLKKADNNNSNINTYGDKKCKLKNKINYSVDKENTFSEKKNNSKIKELYDKNTTNKIKKELIQPYKKSPYKNKRTFNNKNYQSQLLNIIKTNKSNSFIIQKNKKVENICSDSNIDNSLQNKCTNLDQLGVKNIFNLSKETPSTRNTLKNEIKISENILSNKYNKIPNNQEKSKNINKKYPLNNNNKNETSKKICIKKYLSKRNILDKKIQKKKNHSFEFKHKHNLNLTQLRNINSKSKITKELNKSKKISLFSEKAFLTIKYPKTTSNKSNTITKPFQTNVSKNIITLRKYPINNKLEIPNVQFNPKRTNININIKKIKRRKHSSFNSSKSKINKFEEKIKKIKIDKKQAKTEKHSKKNQNKSCDNLNIFNFKTIQNNFKEKENKIEIEKTIPHVFSAILKRKGFKQKEYPNMVLKTNSSQGNLLARKNLTLIYKEMKKIKDIDYICKKGFSGPGIKKTNQDNYFIYKNFLNNNNYLYIGVCDGHGIFGQDISSYLVYNIPQNLSNDLLNNNIKKISSEKIENIYHYIETSFIQTNIKLNTDERIDSTYSGSTCTSIIYTPKKIITINVGDSRCILGKYNNNKWIPKILTKDHKPDDPNELDRIISSGGKVEPYKDNFGNFVGPERVWKKEGQVPGLAMSRSFGDEVGHEVGVIVNPEINEYEFLNEDKFIVLASDGLWEFISNEEVIDIVKEFYLENDIKGGLDCLYREASKRWIMEEEIIDDITIILVFLN